MGGGYPCNCCGSATPCHCSGTTFTQFEVTISGVTDGTCSGYFYGDPASKVGADTVNKSYVCPKTYVSAQECSGEVVCEVGGNGRQMYLYFPPYTNSCSCYDVTTLALQQPGGCSWLHSVVTAAIQYIDGIDILLRVRLLYLEFVGYNDGYLSHDLYDPIPAIIEWEKTIPVADCLTIDENLTLVTEDNGVCSWPTLFNPPGTWDFSASVANLVLS